MAANNTLNTEQIQNKRVIVTDSFWGHTRKLVRVQMIFYQ